MIHRQVFIHLPITARLRRRVYRRLVITLATATVLRLPRHTPGAQARPEVQLDKLELLVGANGVNRAVAHHLPRINETVINKHDEITLTRASADIYCQYHVEVCELIYVTPGRFSARNLLLSVKHRAHNETQSSQTDQNVVTNYFSRMLWNISLSMQIQKFNSQNISFYVN